MDGVRSRNESAWLLPNDGTRTSHRLRRDMRRFADEDEIDLVIVGCGAGGSVLLQRLARAGWRVAALDAGPFWDPDADWVSDEAGSHHLYWTDPRVIAGTDPVPMGSNGCDDPCEHHIRVTADARPRRPGRCSGQSGIHLSARHMRPPRSISSLPLWTIVVLSLSRTR
jgi:choline dehydrogenase-like flavoprotein